MADVGSLRAKIKLDTGGFDRGIKKAKVGLVGFGETAMKLNQTLELAGRAMRGMSTVAKTTFGTFIQAADTAEKYRVRLDVLLSSQKEGARMFKEMSKFAKGVPFEYEKIMESATALSGVMEGGVDEVKRWMPMVADLAAVSNLPIQETTTQLIRMYSAGASAADMFRERGVTAMLGFKAGVVYTAEETRKKLMDAFNDPLSRFRGASVGLAKTWTGALSMLRDRWFLFRKETMDGGLFDGIKAAIQRVIALLDEWEKNGVLTKWAKEIEQVFAGTINTVIKGVGNVISTWKGFKVVYSDAMVSLYEMKIGWYEFGTTAMKLIYSIRKKFGDAFHGMKQDMTLFINKAIEAFNKVSGLSVGRLSMPKYSSKVFDPETYDKEIQRGEHWIEIWSKMGAEGVKSIKEVEQAMEAMTIRVGDKVEKAKLLGDMGDKGKRAPKPKADSSKLTKTIKSLDTMMSDEKFAQSTIGMSGLKLQMAEIGHETEKMKSKYADMFKGEDQTRINSMIDKLRELKEETAGLSDTYSKQQANFQAFSETMEETMNSLAGPLADFFAKFAETGKASFKELAQSLVKSLQMFAAQKTAHLLMTAAYQGIMSLVHSANKDEGAATTARAAAGAALTGAGIMGSFVAGSGLAGMAHDGISNIPEQGTWLLDKNERVLGADTNQDLKQYMKKGGGGVNMTVNINNSDEEGVMRSLPHMKRMIVDAVSGDIASNGQIRKTIQNYT